MSYEEDVRGTRWDGTENLWVAVTQDYPLRSSLSKNIIHALQRYLKKKKAKLHLFLKKRVFWPLPAKLSNVSIHRLLFCFVSVFFSYYPCFWSISLPRNLWPSFKSYSIRLLSFGSKFSLLAPWSRMSGLILCCSELILENTENTGDEFLMLKMQWILDRTSACP